MLAAIHKTAFYPYAPERVWGALTDPRALAEWLMPNDFKPVVGHKFVFQVDPLPGFPNINECEVLEVESPRRLVYSWMPGPKKAGDARPAPSIVSWVLAAEDGGTRLTLDHSGLTHTHAWYQRFMLSFCWGTIVKRLIPKCAANVGADGRFTPGVFPLEKRSYKCKTIPPHLVR
ncbi:MAG TPA: SRPBCC domain-containing protein [Phycisphaerae bacterium]|nr:SRPBCC domain-containing protein [Phycisphaerae bacterium]